MNDEAKKYTALHTPKSKSGFELQPKELDSSDATLTDYENKPIEIDSFH